KRLRSARPPSAMGWISSFLPSRLLGYFDDDVGGLHHGDRADPRTQAQLVGGLTSHQRDQAVGSRLDLHLRRDPVLDHAGHDAWKAVASRLAEDWLGRRLIARGACKSGQVGPVDKPLSAGSPPCLEPAAIGQTPDGIDT